MENLNAEQIIKALECCTRDTVDCDNCPYGVGFDENCFDDAKRDALSLIKELTEEIERLHASCTEFEQKCASVKADTVRKMRDRFNKVFGGMDATQGLLRRTFDQIANELLTEGV